MHRGHAAADYQEDVLTGMARDFLGAADPRPFFLVLTPTAPHLEGSRKSDDDGIAVRPAPRYADTPRLDVVPPESQPSFNEAEMSDKPAFMRSLPTVSPDKERDVYNSKVAAIRAVDDMLGAVVDPLAASGRLATTTIIVTSDNGYQYGTHRRDGKTDMVEESIRVPMLIRAPAQVTPRHVGEWVMNTDWAPTIADLGGATPDIAVDGITLSPWVMGGTAPGRQAMLVEQASDDAFGPHPPQHITGDAKGRVTLTYITDLVRVQQMRTLASQLGVLQACVGPACVVR